MMPRVLLAHGFVGECQAEQPVKGAGRVGSRTFVDG